MKTPRLFNALTATAIAATAVAYATGDDEGTDAAWLGVATAPLDEVAAAQLDLPEGVGVAVKIVVPDSPAATAGLVRNDILFDVAGTAVNSPEHLSELVRSHRTGDEIGVGVMQRGKRVELQVTLGSRPHDLPAAEPEGPATLKIDLGDLGHLDMKEFPFGGDIRDIEKHMEKMRAQMQMHLEGMIDLEGLDNLQGAIDIIDSGSKSVSMRDADGSSIEVHTQDDQTKVLAKDAAGEVLFDGPANTEEERAKMPERVRELFETAQGSGAGLNFQGFRFGLPKLGVPELKPGRKIEPKGAEKEGGAPAPPAKIEGGKVEL